MELGSISVGAFDRIRMGPRVSGSAADETGPLTSRCKIRYALLQRRFCLGDGSEKRNEGLSKEHVYETVSMT